MTQKDKTTLRLILMVIYAALILLLLPWAPIAIWSAVFLSDPMPQEFGLSFLFSKVIPFFILMYPILLLHGVISSWQAMRKDKSAGLVVFRAMYPILSIIPVLLIVIVFFRQ